MSKGKPQVQYGLWPSALSAKDLAETLRLSEVEWDNDGTLVWLEGRSDRGVLVALPDRESAPKELTTTLSVRAKVGYGGGNFTIADGHAIFAGDDGRLYRQALNAGSARPITPAFGCAASPTVSPDGAWVVYVHHDGANDCLALVDVEGKRWPQKLVEGADFYMQPRWHPDGGGVAFIEWDHPNMPWDSTRLAFARLEVLGDLPRLKKKEIWLEGKDLSVFQPEFSPDGRAVAYVADPDGWWRLYVRALKGGKEKAVSPKGVEVAVPAWVQGERTHGFSRDGKALYFLQNERGSWSLWSYALHGGKVQRHDALAAYTHLAMPSLCAPRGTIALLGSSDQTPTRLLCYEPHGAKVTVLRRSSGERVSPEVFSKGEPISWKCGKTDVHGLFYEPVHPEVQGIGLPPLVVLVHGGPTSQRHAAFNGEVQFFTTRGYAVLNVNYRGSTGYGRRYRDALKGQWGAYDVEDCVSGAKFLSDAGEVNPGKRVIMGGSAGGLTVLLALIHHPGFFKAGVCLYGVTNQFTLAADTHKFEARYSDSLIGPLSQASALYRERSPLFFADRIQDPLILFQGAEDRVVPRSQSDAITDSLRRRGVPFEYHVYEGEGHGWRKRETIERYYTELEAFLRLHVIYA